jgi:hypothetical protein
MKKTINKHAVYLYGKRAWRGISMAAVFILLLACFDSYAGTVTQKKAADKGKTTEKKQDAFKKKIDGEWSGMLMLFNGSKFPIKLAIKRSGDSLSGKFAIGTDIPVDISGGKIQDGNTVTFSVVKKGSVAPPMFFLLMWAKQDLLKGGFYYGKDTEMAGMAILNRK